MRILIISIFFLALAASTSAQTNARIETELVTAIKDVEKYSTYGPTGDAEKLSRANRVFKEKLLKYTKIPSTLTYGFNKLNGHMMNAISEDGKFRIYSWDTQDGGTMHYHYSVYRYRGTNGKVYSKGDKFSEERDPSSFVTQIFTMDTTRGKIYIVCSTAIAQTNDHVQFANLYKIAGDALIDEVNLIKTKSGLTNSLSFEYNFFSVVDHKERPIKLIFFDKKTKTLKIPVVVEDEKFPNGKVTDRYIRYRFNGKYFVKVS